MLSVSRICGRLGYELLIPSMFSIGRSVAVRYCSTKPEDFLKSLELSAELARKMRDVKASIYASKEGQSRLSVSTIQDKSSMYGVRDFLSGDFTLMASALLDKDLKTVASFLVNGWNVSDETTSVLEWKIPNPYYFSSRLLRQIFEMDKSYCSAVLHLFCAYKSSGFSLQREINDSVLSGEDVEYTVFLLDFISDIDFKGVYKESRGEFLVRWISGREDHGRGVDQDMLFARRVLKGFLENEWTHWLLKADLYKAGTPYTPDMILVSDKLHFIDRMEEWYFIRSELNFDCEKIPLYRSRGTGDFSHFTPMSYALRSCDIVEVKNLIALGWSAEIERKVQERLHASTDRLSDRRFGECKVIHASEYLKMIFKGSDIIKNKEFYTEITGMAEFSLFVFISDR